MPIEKTIRNRVFQEQKPLLDTSSIQNELVLLQFNEQLSKKSFASSKEITNGYQKKEDLNTDMNHEEIVCKTPPSQLDDASLESYVSTRGDDTDPLTCLKCKKMFLSKASLRNHGTTIDPCDESRVVISSTGGKIESRTCFKCDKTFSSCQGLRKHLKRIKSCDQEKEIVSTVIRRQSLTPKKTCSKCGKTFSSSQNLRIHMNRVKPCTQDRKNVLDPTTLSGETLPTIVTSMSSDELSKGAERTVRAKYQARKAYLVNRTKETETKLDLDKNAPDETLHESDKVESLSRGVKRPRVQEEPAQEHESAGSPSDVSGLTQPRTRTPSHTTTSKKVSTSEGKSGHQLNKGHNGDLLAGGCSCPPCVRRWARKLMIRMQQLEDEVLMLSREKSTGAATTKTASAKPRVDSEATQCLSESVTGGVISSFQAKPADIFESLINFSNAAVTSQLSERGVSNNEASTKLGVLLEADGQSLHNRDNLGGLQRVDDGNENQSVIASVMQAVNSDTQSLIDAYKHMNDQILLNERAVEESSSHVHALVGYSPTAATDFRRQVNELQASIGAEKTKRDVRVAALIAHVWKPRYEEFKSLFDTPFQNAPRNEQVYHKKWAEVASEIYMKDNIISELERQMEALGGGNGRSRYAEMGELSSKIAAEYAAKMALESKREGFYVGLVQSNSRIRTLVRNALL